MASMEINPPPQSNPRDRIIHRLVVLGVPQKLLNLQQDGLVAFAKNNKRLLSELVLAILPPDEEVAEPLRDASKSVLKKQLASVTMKVPFRESMLWLKWLMFEGDPSHATRTLSKMSVGQRGVCGAVWGNNDIAYRCKTCEHDPTCAICVPCFKNGDHEGHDYSIIYTGCGCCDCGDVTAWKRQGFCSKHKGAEQIQPLPEEYAVVVGPVLRCLFDCWKSKLLRSETACRENPRVTDRAVECKKAANELTYFVVEMLLDFCKCSESLLSFVSSTILSSVDFLGILVRAERFLSDAIVKKLHELLLKLMGEPNFKYEFAKVFLDYYSTVVSEALKDSTNLTFKKYPLLPIFSVQIFTVPTLTPRLVKEMNLLTMLLGCLEDIFNSCAGEDGCLQVTKWSNLYDVSIRVIEDFRFVMSHAIVPKYVIHEKQDISRTWLRLSAFVQGMYPQKRETGLHIEEENESMHLPFLLGHLFANIHSLLVDGAFSVGSDHTEDELSLRIIKQDMDDSDTPRHAKVGRLSQESSACTAVGSSSLMFSEDKSNTLYSAVLSSVTWLTFECLRAIENWLGADNTSSTIFDVSSSRTSNYSESSFSAWKRTLLEIRKGKHIFGRCSSSSEDHGRHTSSLLHSSDMSSDIQNGKISGQENKLMAVDETTLANACISPESGDAAMEIDGPMDIDALRLMSLSEWPDIKYDVSSQNVSVHIPLHRLLALLIQRSLQRCSGEEPGFIAASFENLSSTISTDLFQNILRGCHPCGFSAFVMEHPLRIRVFCAQVHAGMWRQNGEAAPFTCEWYRSVRWSEQFMELDLFLLQCCAALAPADLYMKRILERFGLSSYLSLKLERSSEYEPVLVKQMLTLIIQIITERRFCGLTKAECVKRDLIHKLSVADATHSQLVKSLPRDLTKFQQLNEILETVAVYSNPSGLNQGTYSLQWTFWKDLDLYYHRWTSRDLQAAEERYLSFHGVSALTSQIPRWNKIYPPFQGLARIGTCKTVLQIVRAVLFYAVFSDKSADSRAPDEILLTALHLLSLALDICSEHKGSGDRSCYDGDFIPVIAFACEDVSEGLYFEAGQQSLLSLLVILMRMYSKEGLGNSEDGSWNFSSLIGNLLKKSAVIDCVCMNKLQVLAPELVSHVTRPNSDTVISGPASDSEKRKAKAKERQAAILEKMRAEQSKFLNSISPSVDDGSEVEQEKVGSDVEDNSDEPAEVICSLCHDPSSKSHLSFLVLLQNSRLLSYIDRGPVSWDQSRSADKEHVSKTKGEMIDQSSMSRFLSSGVVSSSRVRQLLSDHVNRKTATGQSGINKLSSSTRVLSSCDLRQLVEKAVNEFALHGRPRDVDAFLEVLKDRCPDLRDIQVPCDINDEKETTSCTFYTIEEDMYFHIQREVHDKLHSKFIEVRMLTTVDRDQENIEHAKSSLLGYYIASLSRGGREDPSSSESSNDKGPIEYSRLSAYDGFGPADCDGIYLSSCGHAAHQECLDRYLSSLKERHLRRVVFEGGHIVDPDKGEFLCPVCRGLANSILPSLPTESQKLSKEPMDTGVSSSHVTSPSCESAECFIQQGLALLQSAANAAGKVATLKDFPLHRCEQKDPNLEPISSLLFKMYFPADLDKISGSDRVSHPMLMWDLVKYSLLSMEIASRSGGKYAAPSYSLNALYKELESSSRFILSLLLKHVQNSRKNSLRVLQRFIAIKRFAESTCSGVSEDDESIITGQGAMKRILENLDNPVAYPDIQFWSRASDPVLARDPFSSLMWVLFCLPYRFLSSEDSLLSLVHVFYVVSVVQGITTYLVKNKSDISGLDVDDCLFTDISKLMREFRSAHQYFASDYIDSSSNIKNIVRVLSFPYLRRCALLLKLLSSYNQVPFCERYNVLDRSSATSNATNTTYVPLVELNDIQEIEAVLKIPSLDATLKDAVVRSLAHKWFCHFGKKYEDKRYPGAIHCNPAVPFQLLRLPRVYHDLLQRYIKQRCCDCNNVLDEPALCLLCGRLCSRSWKPCCRESGCQTHAVACGSGTGVFLLIRRTTILLQRSARQSPWPSPYLDAFGEEDAFDEEVNCFLLFKTTFNQDFEMHRGKPLFLNEERYAALTYLVASHGLDQSSKVLGQTTVGSFFMV